MGNPCYITEFRGIKRAFGQGSSAEFRERGKQRRRGCNDGRCVPKPNLLKAVLVKAAFLCSWGARVGHLVLRVLCQI